MTEDKISSQPAVWKMIYLARRNPQLAAVDFPQAWREHSALGRQCKNVGQRVKAVAQCSRQLQVIHSSLSTDYDGVNLMVLADREAGSVIWRDPETLAVMRPDEPRVFADYVRNFSMLCRQQVLHSLLPTDALPQKDQQILIGFLQRSDDWQGAAPVLQSCPAPWLTGGLAKAVRVVCNTLDEAAPAGYGYRYVVEWWFDSSEAAQNGIQQLQAAGDTTGGTDETYAWGDSVFMLTQVTHSRP